MHNNVTNNPKLSIEQYLIILSLQNIEIRGKVPFLRDRID